MKLSKTQLELLTDLVEIVESVIDQEPTEVEFDYELMEKGTHRTVDALIRRGLLADVGNGGFSVTGSGLAQYRIEKAFSPR
jgi:hypothetical protein